MPKYTIEVELESNHDLEQVFDHTKRAMNLYFDDDKDKVTKVRVSSTLEFNSESPCQEQNQ